MKRLRIVFAAVTVAVALAATPAALAVFWPAHNSYIASSAGYAWVRTCPNTGCTAIARLWNNTWITMRCWVDSQWATGNYSSPRWFRVSFSGSDFYTEGFVHSSLVAYQAWTPHC
jgi:hypothetical protein